MQQLHLVVDVAQARGRVVLGRGDDAAEAEGGQLVAVLADDAPAGAGGAGVDAEDDHATVPPRPGLDGGQGRAVAVAAAESLTATPPP